jgi:hypothetical protein
MLKKCINNATMCGRPRSEQIIPSREENADTVQWVESPKMGRKK